MPAFSIAIPCHNRPDLLAQGIASCLRQSEPDFEVVISDDCSDADLGAVVASFGDARLRYSRSDERLGAVRNHARAVALTTGEYVICLNSDDLLLRDCLRIGGRALDEAPRAAAVYFSPVLLEGTRATGTLDVPAVPFADAAVFARSPWLEKYSGSSPSCCLFRRSAYTRLGGYRQTLRFAHDFDMFVRFMAEGGGVVFLPVALSAYRRHPEQSASKGSGSLNGLKDVLDLWSDPLYARWPASDIADLVLVNVSLALRYGGRVRDVLDELRARGLLVKVASGMPAALARRARRRAGRPEPHAGASYAKALNAGDAMRETAALAASFIAPVSSEGRTGTWE